MNKNQYSEIKNKEDYKLVLERDGYNILFSMKESCFKYSSNNRILKKDFKTVGEVITFHDEHLQGEE